MIKAVSPRTLMELAVKVMRQTVPEPRADKKASPLVGAVLRKPDGTVETACRGELRHGDHAEFTLLERKNRDRKLEGSILFSTLEPCAPDSRRPPKLSCAQRIVLARIKEVWVGIEDPDPMVDRKGIKYLQDSGVKIHMFDRDLQETIQAENKRFITQAMDRGKRAREAKPTKADVLSPLENALESSTAMDFSAQALEQYRAIAKIKDKVGSVSFTRRLIQQGLLKLAAGRRIPTAYGLLLFGKEPRVGIPQAGLLGTIHYPEGKEEFRDFDGPQVFAPAEALQWLRDKLPNPISRSETRRREVNDVFFELVREGIVNALVHRDYAIQGAKCHLIVTPGKVVVRSPGKPVDPIRLEQMQSFDAPMLSRNPIMHYVFSRMEMAEERGMGLKSMRNRAEQSGLPLPEYRWDNPYLTLTLYQDARGAVTDLALDVLEDLGKDEQKGWEFLVTKAVVTRKKYAEHMDFDDRKAQRHLKRFVELGLLRKVGTSSRTFYEVRKR